MDTQGHVKIKVGNLEFEAGGAEDFVEKQLERFWEIIPSEAIPQQIPSVKQTVADAVPPEEQKQVGAPTSNGAAPSLLDFYRTKNPKTDVERVTVVAAFAKDHRQQGEVSEEVLRPFIQELAVQGQTVPKNIRNAIWNASAKARGYLERIKGKRNAYRLTTAGVVLVYKTLPQRGQPNAG